MTDRDRLKDAVVEAAQILAHSCGVIRGRTPEDDDIYTVELEHIRELNAAIAALSAHDTKAEAEAVEETVDDRFVQIAVDPAENGGGIYALTASGRLFSRMHDRQAPWEEQPLPLPRPAEVTGEVEG